MREIESKAPTTLERGYPPPCYPYLTSFISTHCLDLGQKYPNIPEHTDTPKRPNLGQTLKIFPRLAIMGRENTQIF